MDIRSVLKKVSLPDLKNIVRKHNKHFNIKIGQRKEDLIDAIANVYKELSGSFLIPKEFKLRLTELAKKGVIKKKQLARQEPPQEEPEPEPPKEEPEPETTKAEKGLAALVSKKVSKDDVNKSFKEFVELLKQNKPQDNIEDLSKLRFKIHKQILLIFYNQLFAKNKGKLTQEVINKTNKQIEELAEEYTDDNEDLIYINKFVSDKFQDTVPKANLARNVRWYFYKYGVNDDLSNYFKDTLFYIRNQEEYEARTFRGDIDRLSDKKFEKGSASDSVVKSSREVLSQLKRKQDDIEKYGNYPYLQEYIDKFNEAMKTSIFARRIKQAQKE